MQGALSKGDLKAGRRRRLGQTDGTKPEAKARGTNWHN